MINLPAKPPGSNITVERDFNRLTICWKNPRGGGIGRYGQAAFLTLWMCGWFFGEAAALRQVLVGQGGGFLIFWLAAWTFGGAFCAATIFRLIRPARPERISLDSLQLEHDPGSAPVDWSGFGRTQRRNPLDVFKHRRKQTFARKDVGEIRLDRVGERQRLSFDYGAQRIEVGEFLEEPEREWLFAALRSWKSV
jgi:hypothetical protein